MTISILLADDQALLRQGFRMVLSAEADLAVVGEAGDGDEAVRMTGLLRPDVVLMDVRMPGTDGIEATRQIVARTPSARVIILTTYGIDRYAFSGLNAGASGFLLKDVPSAELIYGIRAVASGDAIVAPSTTRRLLERFAPQVSGADGIDPAILRARLSALTDRERGVLELVARGLSNPEIAVALVVAEATVKTHIHRILAKQQLRDRVQAVVLAYELGLVVPGTHAANHDQAM